MSKLRPLTAVVAGALLVGVLSGCGSLLPTSNSTTPSAAAPSPSAPSQTVEPVPTEAPPWVAPTAPTEDPEAPPADWSDEELLGACKEAWVASGEPIDWSRYSPDATIEARGSEWFVAIPSSDGSKSLECMVGGTPTDASVRTLS
ncbi:MAG: hypothetical protein JWP66_139 [Naasia sp.]|nr:hypothetical protein [Naasia sp.]